jgi:hypothetical protein
LVDLEEDAMMQSNKMILPDSECKDN